MWSVRSSSGCREVVPAPANMRPRPHTGAGQGDQPERQGDGGEEGAEGDSRHVRGLLKRGERENQGAVRRDAPLRLARERARGQARAGTAVRWNGRVADSAEL